MTSAIEGTPLTLAPSVELLTKAFMKNYLLQVVKLLGSPGNYIRQAITHSFPGQ